MNQSLPAWITDHCQFGNHGEPFLWHGSGNDGVDIAIMQLINLAKDNPKMAHEAAEFIDACVKDAAQQSVQADLLSVPHGLSCACEDCEHRADATFKPASR